MCRASESIDEALDNSNNFSLYNNNICLKSNNMNNIYNNNKELALRYLAPSVPRPRRCKAHGNENTPQQSLQDAFGVSENRAP